MCDSNLDLFPKKIVFDCEVFPHLFVLAAHELDAQNVASGETKSFATIREAYAYLCENNDALFIGFNSNGYDDYIISVIMNTAGMCTPEDLSEVSRGLIDGGVRPAPVSFRSYDVYDPIEVGMRSLKMYCGSAGNSLYDSPYSFKDDRTYTDEEIEDIASYCRKDVGYTCEIFAKEFEYYIASCARVSVLKDAGVTATDNKSVVCCRSASLGRTLFQGLCYNGRDCRDDMRTTIKFIAPFEKFAGVGSAYAFYKAIVDSADESSSETDFYDKSKCPVVTLQDGMEVQLGWGGAHGALEAYVKPAQTRILYADVSSMYPTLMIKHDLYPHTFTIEAKDVYEYFYHSRLDYKARGEKLKSQAAKRLLASLTGMLKDRYADFRAEWANNSIVVNGQLSVVALAYQLSKRCKTVQVNTDGVMSEVADADVEWWNKIVDGWCEAFQYSVSKHEVKELIQSNVNNYYMVDDEGEVRKGAAYALNERYFNDKTICKRVLPICVATGKMPITLIRESRAIEEFFILIKTTDTFPFLYDTISGEWSEARCLRVIACRYDEELARKGGFRYVNWVKVRGDKKVEKAQKVSDFPEHAIYLPDAINAYDTDLLFELIDFGYYASKVMKAVEPFIEPWKNRRQLTFEL